MRWLSTVVTDAPKQPPHAAATRGAAASTAAEEAARRRMRMAAGRAPRVPPPPAALSRAYRAGDPPATALARHGCHGLERDAQLAPVHLGRVRRQRAAREDPDLVPVGGQPHLVGAALLLAE